MARRAGLVLERAHRRLIGCYVRVRRVQSDCCAFARRSVQVMAVVAGHFVPSVHPGIPERQMPVARVAAQAHAAALFGWRFLGERPQLTDAPAASLLRVLDYPLPMAYRAFAG